MAETIPHWLSKRAELSPDQTAIELPDGYHMTFLELASASQTFAKKLAENGVKEGSHIGILSNNSIDMVITIHALSYLGAVSVMLNTRLKEEELNYQVKDADVSFIIVSDEMENRIRKMKFPVSVLINTFSQIEQSTEKNTELKTEINIDNVFTIIYTSGTTGFPKGVMHTYGNHWWSAIGSALNLGLSENDKWLATLPIFHVGGLSIFIRSVIYGIPVYLLEKYDPALIHEAIMKKDVTIVSVVTIMLKELVQLLGNNHYPTAFRCMLLGGGPAPKPLLNQAKARRIPVFQSYGMTETSSQIVTLSPKNALEKIGSAGKPLFPAQLKIGNNKGEHVGEIYVKGPMVASGYYKNETATQKALRNGWLATGDLGYVDNEGFLYVVDRRNDLIISGGENIYPSEIESVLAGMEQIHEIGVVGKNDVKWGQVPVAFVVKNEEHVTSEDIVNYAKNALANYKIPKELYFVASLPKNASNKLLRNKLIERLEKRNK
ncbi:o-succinylbenzoate--CoA ligase [Virgibacillus alimentarius]|uniref:2-succinylbenzoate--CoA ligase n=1 Tax=Virgibacillus alimentarius TaxID=698769 RepID=A0ABS4S707_9BACI|nr:o-succinylbenzoate--CoA ligase [Virgibacillus alimentarius]MBP2257286.1 O-succinylbenzoic acid--CoA ligase [Virgibacillus alimentarius]